MVLVCFPLCNCRERVHLFLIQIWDINLRIRLHYGLLQIILNSAINFFAQNASSIVSYTYYLQKFIEGLRKYTEDIVLHIVHLCQRDVKSSRNCHDQDMGMLSPTLLRLRLWMISFIRIFGSVQI